MNADKTKEMHCFHLRLSAFICGSLSLLLGCSSAIQSGFNPALSGDDLIKMTDDMAMKIVASPAVQSAIQKEGALKVVVEPVENQMRAEVLPRGAAEAFTGRVRTLLSRHAPDRFIWIMNRDAYYRLRQRELEGVELGPAPEAINPQYALTARFSSLASEDPKRRSSYYLCVFDLTDIQRRNIVWSGSYELKKVAVKGFLD
jgi:hypothetical protein